MAVYNGAKYLHGTMDSILNQSFTDFEYIIINDGSTDETTHIVNAFTDHRLVILQNQANQGLAYSLNRGIEIAQGRYIARIDADDLARPARLEKQVDFLRAHPEIGIVGTGGIILDDAGQKIGEKHFPGSDLEIRWTSLLTNPFLHPTVMFRHDVLRQHHLQYDPGLRATQDYDLWTRLLIYTQGANLPEALTGYRQSEASITAQSRTLQLSNHDAIAFRTIQAMLPDFRISPQQVSQLRGAFIGGDLQNRERKRQRAQCAPLYLDLLAAFLAQNAHQPDSRSLCQRETLCIALLGLQQFQPSAWVPVVSRACRLDPGSLIPMTAYLINKHVWKRGWRAIRRLLGQKHA